MKKINHGFSEKKHESYSSCCGQHENTSNHLSRREFVKVAGATTIGAVAISGLSWSVLASAQNRENTAIQRHALVVKPVFIYATPTRKDQRSWRSWGAIQTEQDADKEIVRIQDELKKLHTQADFPVQFLPVRRVNRDQDFNDIGNIEAVDAFLVYAAGKKMDALDKLYKTGKDMIIFCRHKSGPVYHGYEYLSPRFLRRDTDNLSLTGVDENDVVIDSQDELLWRLRALCGLKNTVASRIIAIGGSGAWAHPEGDVQKMVDEKFKLDIRTISYEELGKLIKEAQSDNELVARAKSRADKYLNDNKITLETKRQFVDNAFVLEDIFKRIMDKYNCRAITIKGCMGTIMPLAETTACLTLSLLNDAGYLAFCESDFVAIPAGILLANISGKPAFLNDPTYPHNGVITLAHCTAPRRMDGEKLEPARIVTHFESDYGAAPKVEMLLDQTVSNIMADFSVNHYVGVLGKIVDNPFMDICRSQIDVSYNSDDKIVAEKMRGFHWVTAYGDYMKEIGYALKRIGIKFDNLV